MPRGSAKKRPQHGSRTRSRRDGGWDSGEVVKVSQQLLALGLRKKGVIGDGNCLFASVAEHLYSNPFRHDEVRARCTEYMEKNATSLEPYLLEEDLEDMKVKNFAEYVSTMGRNGVWGGNMELLCMGIVFKKNFVVHRMGERPYVLVAPEASETFHLCYDGQHYDMVHAIAGATLGLAVQTPSSSNPTPTQDTGSGGSKSDCKGSAAPITSSASAMGGAPPSNRKLPPRNKPCPCGSRRTFKTCCALKPATPAAVGKCHEEEILASTFGGISI